MKYIYIVFTILAMYLSVSCDENGDSGYYEDQDRVYFVEDSIICRLGEMSIDVEKYIVQVPVKVLGNNVGTERKFKVTLDRKLTTALENFYTALPEEFVVNKDSVNAFIPIELLRHRIDSDKDVTYRIVLKLEDNDMFGQGVQEKLQTKIVFSNYLQEPDWWYTFSTMYWGTYQPEKYQKMMELWGGPISYDDLSNSMIKVILCAKDMYDYFQQHPEFGMVFPENIVWPYE